MSNWESLEFRKDFLKSIKTTENKNRKAKSLQEYEIYNGNLNQYVEGYLKGQLSEKTVSQMPIISSIDIAKRIADAEASVYKSNPIREFQDISDDDKNSLEYVYSDAMADIKLMKSNRYYKLQSQSLLQVIPKDGKLEIRVLFPHNYDVIPSENDPEKADSIIISAFNKQEFVQGNRKKEFNPNYVIGSYRDNENQLSADSDDYKSKVERYVVWSDEYNFIMNGHGEIISDDFKNPIGILPFIDIAADKDYNYFVDRGSQLTNFAIQYNSALSDLANIVRMQGYSQAVMIAPAEAMPEHLIVGANSIIKLAVDSNNPAPTDFKFVSPSPDLAGSIDFIEVLISNFLSARGLSVSTVSGKQSAEKYTSGFDRFLSMIDKFEATKQDFVIYQRVEELLFEIIKAWLSYYSGSDELQKKYHVSSSIKDASMTIKFGKPDAAASEKEKLEVIQQKIELGLIDKVSALMELNGITEIEAEEKLEKIDNRGAFQETGGE